MKRLFNIAFCLATLFIFAGCNKADTLQKDVKSVRQILESVARKSEDKALDETACFDDGIFRDNCKKLYGIDYSELADGGIMYVSDGGSADEISIIKMKENHERAVQVLEKRAEKRVRDFTGYKPDERAKIENAKIFGLNGFSVLIISDNADSLMKIIENEIS
ncbi:MAG: DUF4358 domain-containing protein [Ruminococcus sp.]|nr:DUF4358 domain-containing protein [Ruminococcus sp.]